MSKESAPTQDALIRSGLPRDLAGKLESWYQFWYSLSELRRESICAESQRTLKTIGEVATEWGLWSWPPVWTGADQIIEGVPS